MNDKNSKYNKPVKKPEQSGTQATHKVQVAHSPAYPSWLNYALLGGILILTFWCYHYSLDNQFTNWDDGVYITQNPFIKSLSSGNVKSLLFKDVTQNYYHPITMLSLALNWHFSGMNPRPYYATEIIIHLLNTVLVFFLSLALFNAMVKKGYGKIKGIPYVAGLCALWFGVHPMHVESVSWAAERKDVLYLFFYLWGLLAYVKYIMENKKMLMVLVALFYFLSLFSKPLAVVFPLTLFTLDVLLKRKIEWKLLLEKIPLFVISVIFGYLAFKMQDEHGAITAFHVNTYTQKLMFAGYGYSMYLIKLFVPFSLCSFYPFPALMGSSYLPLYFYFAPFLDIILTLGILFLAYKKGENYFRVALFGFGFYFFNVMFILQFVSAGPSIMAERYTYVSYFGVVFMLVYFIHILIDKIPSLKTPVIIMVAAFSCMLAYLCQARTEVWHDTRTLWEDVVAKYPAKVDTVYSEDHSHSVIRVQTGVETAYKDLGDYYLLEKKPPDYDSAYMEYAILELTNCTDPAVYSNLGNIWAIRNNFPKSLEEYTKSLKLDSNNAGTYLDRAITYSRMGQFDLAMKDYNRGYKLDSTNKQILEYRGYTLLNGVKDYGAAIGDFNRLIAIDPTNMGYYKNRGAAELNSGKINEAMDDFNKVINANPQDGQCLYYLSFAFNELKSYAKAIEYAQKAQQNGFQLPDGYLAELQESAGTNSK